MSELIAVDELKQRLQKEIEFCEQQRAKCGAGQGLKRGQWEAAAAGLKKALQWINATTIDA